MGLYVSRLFDLFGSFSATDPAKITMLGLDAAGKTTILYKVKLSDNITTIPTIGFNVETVQPTKGVTFTVWDVGGQEKIRNLWHHYYKGCEGLIYVVDSSDRDRLSEAKEELSAVLKSEELQGVPFVVIANKQDLPGAMSPSEMISSLSLRDYRDRKWHIQGACAVTGQGIYEALEQLATLVKQFKRRR